MRAILAYIELAKLDTPTETQLTTDESWLMVGVSSYDESVILGFCADGVRKHESMGRLFPNIKPTADGSFVVELGVVLPDLLPTLKGNAEYCVDLNLGPDSRWRRLAVSNQMARIFYRMGARNRQAILPRCKVDTLEEGNRFGIPRESSHQLLRTMVTTRFHIKGCDAEEALELNIHSMIEEFTLALNRILSSYQLAMQQVHGQFTSAYEANSFPYFYAAIRGGQNGETGCFRVATHVGRVAQNPMNCEGVHADEFRKLLLGEKNPEPYRQVLLSARTSHEAGLSQFALLQMVIAAEMCTAGFVKTRCTGLGISGKYWKQIKNDITYSQMLNLHLLMLSPEKVKAKKDVISKLNQARGLRNDLMHEGEFDVSREQLGEILEATEEYINFVEDLARDGS